MVSDGRGGVMGRHFPTAEIVLLMYILRVPLRAIYRAITEIIFTTWINGQNLGRYITKITKIGNIEDLRGSQWVNIGHNNDINITLLLLIGNFVRSIKGNWHFR